MCPLSDRAPPPAPPPGGTIGELTSHLNVKNNTSKWAQSQSLDIFLAMQVARVGRMRALSPPYRCWLASHTMVLHAPAAHTTQPFQGLCVLVLCTTGISATERMRLKHAR